MRLRAAPRSAAGARQPIAGRLTVRVHPNSSRAEVGGRHGSAEPPVLSVWVTAPALDGRANRAVQDALSDALSVPPASIRLLSGARSRTKVFEVAGADPARLATLIQGRAPTSRSGPRRRPDDP